MEYKDFIYLIEEIRSEMNHNGLDKRYRSALKEAEKALKELKKFF